MTNAYIITYTVNGTPKTHIYSWDIYSVNKLEVKIDDNRNTLTITVNGLLEVFVTNLITVSKVSDYSPETYDNQ